MVIGRRRKRRPRGGPGARGPLRSGARQGHRDEPPNAPSGPPTPRSCAPSCSTATGCRRSFLAEAGIDRADRRADRGPTTTRPNILAAVRAKNEGCPMAIRPRQRPHPRADAGAPRDRRLHQRPRATTVSSILRHIRLGRVRAVYSIGDAEAEVIEAQVLSTSPIAGQPHPRAWGFPEGVLVGAVREGRQGDPPDRSLPRIDDGGEHHRDSSRSPGGRARGRTPVPGVDRLLLIARADLLMPRADRRASSFRASHRGPPRSR